MSDAEREPHAIVDAPYLIALNLGLRQAADSSYWSDASWIKDLARHFDYLPRLTFVAPIVKAPPRPDDRRLPDGHMRVVAFTHGLGRAAFLLSLPRLLFILLREIWRAEIVHTCAAGYPIPVGWIAIPIARLFRKKVVLTIESSVWRIPSGQKAGVRRRLVAWIWEGINRWCLRQADYASYSHEGYRRTLPAPRAGGGVIFQASWIDPDQILSVDDVAVRWRNRIERAGHPTLLFAARMVREKGAHVVADAIGLLAAAQVDLDIDLIGDGDYRALFIPLDGTAIGRGRVRLLDPIPYGPDFLRFLRDYDAILAPSLTDEQPRIVYDAASQGIGAIVSDTEGLRACVEADVTGVMVPPDDAPALARAIAGVDLDRCRAWGEAARERSVRFTHDRMHRDRARDLQRLIRRTA